MAQSLQGSVGPGAVGGAVGSRPTPRGAELLDGALPSPTPRVRGLHTDCYTRHTPARTAPHIAPRLIAQPRRTTTTFRVSTSSKGLLRGSPF